MQAACVLSKGSGSHFPSTVPLSSPLQNEGVGCLSVPPVFLLWVPIYSLSIVVKTNRTGNSIETTRNTETILAL